jgi:glyoxylase-like metal-dependent hydrolase (beta-lactamase superfamily II)
VRFEEVPTRQFAQQQDGILVFDTEYFRPGRVASHLIWHNGQGALVDVGPAAAVPVVLKALAAHQINPAEIQTIFVTHVHLDHAGAAGHLLEACPNASVVVHPRGAKHLVDPTRLMQGALAVFGETVFSKHIGSMVPVSEDRVLIAEDGATFDLAGRSLKVLHTEGHARHHYCLVDVDFGGIFTGDSFGISYRELDTDAGPFVFPATAPVQFDLPAAHAAIERIMNQAPQKIHLAHFGQLDCEQRLADDLHRDLDLLVELARKHANSQDRSKVLHAEIEDCLFQRIRDHGYAGSDAELHALLDFDVAINVQGLEVWLDRMQG